jgi:hypothetical protein
MDPVSIALTLLMKHPSAAASAIENDVIQQPWARQSQYAADNSAVVRIRYTGLLTTTYEMVVAVMVKNDQVRTAVLGDTALVPFNKKCQLEQWSGA